MAIESLNHLINKAEQDKLQNQEKVQLKTESKNKSKDHVTTLNIDNKNVGFKEKAGFLRSFGENAKAVWTQAKQNWAKRREMLHVVPEEDTTKARYEATLQRGGQAVEQASKQSEVLAQKGETLAAQQQEIQDIGDQWSNPLEGQYESASATKPEAVANVASQRQVESGDEWVNPYGENRFQDTESSNGSSETQTSASATTESGANAFAEYASSSKEFAKLADVVRRVNPLKEGNGALATALENGQMNAEQKQLTKVALEKLKQMPNWGKADKQVFEAVAKELTLDKARAGALEQAGLGEVMESHAEILHKNEIFSKFGKLVEANHPLSLDNKALGKAFEDGSPTREDLANGLKAVEAIQKMAKWEANTKNTLAEAKKFMELELYGKVIPFEQGKAKYEKKQNTKRRTTSAVSGQAA